MPLSWVIWGSLLSGTALVVFQRLVLDTPIWQSLVAIALSIPLMLVAMRVLGETNWGPISTMVNVSQAVFGALAPGSLRAGMVSSGITGSVAAESEGLMQDYKAGWLIGSTPRLLTYVQLLGVPVGCITLAYMYPLLVETYGLGGETGLSSPISQRWVGFAKILSQGFGTLPSSALWALLAFSILGVLLTVLEQRRSWRWLVPSPAGVGIGMLIPAVVVPPMLLGALLEWAWRKRFPLGAASYAIPLASGLIAGEAIVAVLLPLLYVSGILSPV
jgi:uncharacterized oligopeptide transporter (OPT) family protein